MNLSERSDRSDLERGSLGPPELRARIATALDAAVDAVAVGPNARALELAVLFVLADPGDEVLVGPGASPGVRDAASVLGVDAVSLDVLDAEALFEATGARTRAIVLGPGDADDERIALSAGLGLPVLLTGARPTDRAGVRSGDDAPLVLASGEHEGGAWLAVLGPEDRTGPVLARLERFAHVFFPHVADVP